MMFCIQWVNFFSGCKLMQLYCLQGRHSAQDLVYATQQRRDSLSTQENLCPVCMFHLDIICREAKVPHVQAPQGHNPSITHLR